MANDRTEEEERRQRVENERVQTDPPVSGTFVNRYKDSYLFISSIQISSKNYYHIL